MNLTIDIAKQIIAKQKENFDSHDFIQTYQTDFEFDYLQDLFACIKQKNVFQKCHTRIGNFLSKNKKALNICDLGKVQSKNIHGNETDCEKYKKL